MLRVRVTFLAISLGLTSVTTAQAGWHEFWDRFHLDFHRNNCWMEPFASVDRQATVVPFNAMVNNGWQSQTTLDQNYFHRETHVLNEAGTRKLHWIMTNAPEEHRTIFVAMSHEPEISERRLDSVQQTLARLLPDQSLPAVIPVERAPRGWPADYIDTIDRKMHATIPSPRLPSFQEAGGSSG